MSGRSINVGGNLDAHRVRDLTGHADQLWTKGDGYLKAKKNPDGTYKLYVSKKSHNWFTRMFSSWRTKRDLTEKLLVNAMVNSGVSRDKAEQVMNEHMEDFGSRESHFRTEDVEMLFHMAGIHDTSRDNRGPMYLVPPLQD